MKNPRLDIMHDLMEGCIPEDLLSINRILIKLNWMTIIQYNSTLESLEFASYERGDKPYPLQNSKKNKKLRGKAVSNWVHIRNWPFIIKKFIMRTDDPVLRLGLMLHEIVERLVALEFYEYEIDILEDQIISYLDLRKTIRDNYPNLMTNPKPKHHYLRKDAIWLCC